LPYPDLYPAPRAQGLLGFDLPMTAWGDSAQTLFCPFSAPLLVTDTIYSYGACWASDSVQFFDIFGNQNVPIGYMGFGVFPWTGRWVAINSPSDEQDIKIFPSPANDFIKIMSSLKEKITMAVIDIFGQQQLSASFFQYSSTLTLDVSSLHSGIYFLHIKDATEFYSQKIVIVH
jgi:hypothetical protein